MKYVILIAIFLLSGEKLLAQEVGDPILFIKWKNVVLSNYATFKSLDTLNQGSGFLIKYKNDTIACTMRPDIRETMLYVKDFGKEFKYWEMYVSQNPAQKVIMDSLFLKYKIVKKISIILYSDLILTFSLKKKNNNIIPLEPDNRKVRNKDTLFLIGYDDNHNLRIVKGIVKTVSNERFSDPQIRLKTNVSLFYPNFVGGPIVDKNGKVVGIFNRAYRQNISNKGRILNPTKVVEDSHFEYFAEGISMRSVLGKDYPN